MFVNEGLKPEASVGHRQGRGAGTILGLDNLISTELNACIWFNKRFNCQETARSTYG